MKHWYQKPNKLLAEYVRTVLIMEGFSEPASNIQPIFTNGMTALFCKTEKDHAGYENIVQFSLFGKLIPPECWSTGRQTTIVAYFFKPFALTGLFNIPYLKLMKTPIDLCNWSPHKYNALRTQLIYSGSSSRKIAILDNLLVQQLGLNNKECEVIKYATDLMMLNTNPEILSEILQERKLNERTFQRLFKKYVGVTPTQYRRICQFQLSFSQLRSKKFNKISDVAFDNGFTDQSHFIRSFKEFTHTTPNDYLQNGLTEKNA